MRLFLALLLDEQTRRFFNDLTDSLKEIERVSWTRAENFHVTLKFLGAVDAQAATSLTKRLKEVDSFRPLCLRPMGLQCFPERGPIRVITAGLSGDLEELRRLHQQIEDICLAGGFPNEARPFRAHVTLGRPREALRASERERLTDRVAGRFPGPEFIIHSFALVESKLRPAGAQYLPVAQFPPQ